MWPLALGASFGLGLVLVARGLAPRELGVAETLSRLAAAEPARSSPLDSSPGWTARVGRPLVRRLGLGWSLPGVEEALALTGREPEWHAAEKAALAVLFGLLPVASASLFALAGLHPPLALPALAAVVAAAVGWTVPDVGVRAEAASRREELRHALASFCDLIRLGMAGGAGTEEALEESAGIGAGWAAVQLRRVLVAARAAAESPWDALARFGREVGVDELVELGHAMALAGTEGARVRGTLAAKAASLRAHQQSGAEADAQAATERMSLPVVMLFAGFMVLIGYPAVVRVMVGL